MDRLGSNTSQQGALVLHNDAAYWRNLQYLQSLRKDHPDLPSPRVCRLLQSLFERWKTKPRWLTEEQVGHLVEWKALSKKKKTEYAQTPIILRKARAVARMLELITSDSIASVADTCRVDPDELLVGTLPPFSVGQGKEFVRYLTPSEACQYSLCFLNELSPMGHIVPDHEQLLKRGLNGLIEECRNSARNSAREQQDFYQAVMICLEAVKSYAAAYARRAESLSKRYAADDARHANLLEIAANLRQSPAQSPQTFRQAVQAIFLLHCAFHWTVEIVPLGRLDQILLPYYEAELRNRLKEAKGRKPALIHKQFRSEAQEILDCMWIKLDENVILHSRFAEDHFNSCDGNLTGYFGSSNFDQGGLLNQWMQQVTIGGVKANDASEPEDASNPLTLLFLECARRLPLNSPTLDLRVHSKTERRVLQAAARALQSGGAHPVLLNDDRIIKALQANTCGAVPLHSLRNYACDGCYETMFAGETEFSFGFIFALDAIERTMNRGAKFPHGWADSQLHLRGIKDSTRTPAAKDLGHTDFWRFLREHLLQSCHAYFSSLLALYGKKLDVAPSPLLSAFIGGCLESGRDLNAGGARYHIFSPLLVGISNAVDSLYVIEYLVYRRKQFTLDELRTCLITNWGQYPSTIGRYVPRERIEAIRKLCRQQPKYGQGIKQIDELAWKLIETFVSCVIEVRDNEIHAPALDRLRHRYGTDDHPFKLHLVPGAGTFEQYVLLGGASGASADGRGIGDPIASDLSPAPLPPDLPPTDEKDRHQRTYRLLRSFQSYDHACIDLLGDGAAVDYNIPEAFHEKKLVEVLERFAQGRGPSVATFTVADPTTMTEAMKRPDDFNLIRVRMGGWTEFFVTLFPIHQEQHRRRPLFT